jgi:cellulose synthase/poly-beta-1,6-N-acetylglucosamine synthase-like glycosyltransferase
MEFVFWGSVFLILYPYLVYPVLVLVWGKVKPWPVRRSVIEPMVTVLIPAYNEADCIGRTIDHLLAQRYPRQRLQILVVSDGSDDGTDEIVRSFAPQGVGLLRQEGRGGKALALNAAVRHARGEIVVFCDANACFHPQAVAQMVSNFADPDVGYVTGRLQLKAASGELSGAGGGAYLRYENMLRAAETGVGSVVGVNGGVDAVRRELYSDIPRELITDFVLPLRVIAAGRRVVYDPMVRSTEDANTEMGAEFRMRVRVALRALQGLVHMRPLLNPWCFPSAAFCLLSHKVLRYAGFVFLVLALLANTWLATRSLVYLWLLVLHLGCYALALLGLARVGGRWLRAFTVVPAYLLVSYAAFAVATLRFLRGQTMATWQPRAG